MYSTTKAMAKGKISPSMEKLIIWCIISGEIFSGFPYFCTIREVEGLGMRLQIELDWKVKAFNPYLQDKMYSLTLGHGTHIHKVQFFLIEMSWKSLERWKHQSDYKAFIFNTVT